MSAPDGAVEPTSSRPTSFSNDPLGVMPPVNARCVCFTNAPDGPAVPVSAFCGTRARLPAGVTEPPIDTVNVVPPGTADGIRLRGRRAA